MELSFSEEKLVSNSRMDTKKVTNVYFKVTNLINLQLPLKWEIKNEAIKEVDLVVAEGHDQDLVIEDKDLIPLVEVVHPAVGVIPPEELLVTVEVIIPVHHLNKFCC